MKYLDKIIDIDLNKHGLIEASAGTGKTYTIENLAIRMIREKCISLDQILIVTFTEKATGELKQRIREKLDDEILAENDSFIKSLFQNSLDNFDQTSIYTIHGFCQNILKDYSFELGENFQSNLINQSDLIEDILKIDIRKRWPKIWGEELFVILNIIEFEENNFCEHIIDVCTRMHLHKSFQLYPESNHETVFESLKNLKKLGLDVINEFINCGLSFNNDLFDILNKNLKNGLKIFAENLKAIQIFITSTDKFFVLNNGKIPEFKKGADKESKIFIEKLLISYEKFISEYFGFKKFFVSAVAMDVLTEANRQKIEKNLITFDDMLIKTEKLLLNINGNLSVLTKLQNKYHFALIDEFQDTDIFQWNIFNNLFLKSNSSKLFLIGDPKQSIYRFRNADIHTYLEAKNIIIQLKNEGLADIYSLQKNYRSLTPLIDDFNLFFGDDNWFGQSSTEENNSIKYQNAIGLKVDSEKESCYSVRKAGIKLLSLNNNTSEEIKNDDEKKSETIGSFYEKYFEQIVQEIIYLKKSDSRIEYGDFCCLFEVREKMTLLKDKLNSANIPFSEFQEGGITESIEALELLYVMLAIKDPDLLSNRSMALLTSFFRISPNNIADYEELPFEHDIYKLLNKWHKFSLNSQWYFLFSSLMDETGVIPYCLEQDIGERKISNFRQIIEWLLIKIDQNKLDIDGICDALRKYRGNDSSLSDEDRKLRISTERKKVQLITIHSSKGLEFKYVFLCKYRSEKKSDKYSFWVRNEDKIQVVVDLNNSELQNLNYDEQEQELKRLMYVAFTRAIHSLYLPYSLSYKDSFYTNIISSVVLSHNINFENIYHQIMPINNTLKNLNQNIKQIEKHISLESLIEQSLIKNTNLLPNIYLQSYSSIALLGVLEDKHIDDENFAVSLITSEEDELPKGSNTGNLFHKIFENISFELVLRYKDIENGLELFQKDKTVNELILNCLSQFLIENRWYNKVSEIVYYTLNNTISKISKDFCLSKLLPSNKIHELEFYYSILNDLNHSEFYLKGFVDLVFRNNEKYYILDWKSNFLDAGYSDDSLDRAIIDHQYDLQYKVYMVFLYEWLVSKGMKKSDWSKFFGGIIYCFIRGSNQQKGYYFRELNELPSIAKIKKELSVLMSNSYNKQNDHIIKFLERGE